MKKSEFLQCIHDLLANKFKEDFFEPHMTKLRLVIDEEIEDEFLRQDGMTDCQKASYFMSKVYLDFDGLNKKVLSVFNMDFLTFVRLRISKGDGWKSIAEKIDSDSHVVKTWAIQSCVLDDLIPLKNLKNLPAIVKIYPKIRIEHRIVKESDGNYYVWYNFQGNIDPNDGWKYFKKIDGAWVHSETGSNDVEFESASRKARDFQEWCFSKTAENVIYTNI